MNFKEALEQAVKENQERGTPFLIEAVVPGLMGVPDDAEEPFELIYDKIVGDSRWADQHEAVYKHDSRFWMVDYEAPSTENQDWESYGTVVYEVEPHEVTVTKYRKVS